MSGASNRFLFLLFLLTLFPIGALAANADCSDLTNAIELETFCPHGTTGSCVLSSATPYKISSSNSSKSSSFPPIEITTGALCITNSTLNGTPLTIYAQSIWLNGGMLQIGSATDPISSDNKVTIVMTGSQSSIKDLAPTPICISDPNISCSNIATTSSNTPNARDITVNKGGQLLMYGAKGLTKNASGSYIHELLDEGTFADCYASEGLTPPKPCKTDSEVVTNNLELDPYFNKSTGSNSWTYLSMPAGSSSYSAANWVQAPVDYTNLKVYTDPSLVKTSAATLPAPEYTLVLAKDVTSDPVTGWQKGDWISVSTTSFSSHQTEIVQICDIFYAENPETNTSVSKALKKDPFYKGMTSDKSAYDSALSLKDPVSVISLTGGACATSQALMNYHFGSLMPTPGFFSQGGSYTNSDSTTYSNVQAGQAYSMYDGALRNFGIDERAEVALLSRNIHLTSTADDGTTSPAKYPVDQYFGGHLVVMNSGASAPDESVQLVGVEIEKFGQPVVGRYPLHFHRLNSQSSQRDNNLLVQDVSVHHSYNKCFVPHATKGVKFYNNVCVRTIGQGFYLEDGYRVTANQFVRNLVSGVMGASLDYTPYNPSTVTPLPSPGQGNNLFWSGDYLTNNNQFLFGGYNPAKIPDTSDSGANTGHPIDSINPNGFWITNFGDQLTPNIFVNNSVAGCQMQGRAYWLVKQGLESIYGTSFPKQTSYPVFQGNRGHGCYAGLDTDARMFLGASDKMTSAPYPVSPDVPVNASQLAPIVIFNDLTFSRIRYKAFWTRSLFSSLLNSRFASNKQGVTILGGGGPEGNMLGFWGLVKDNVFAGISNNNVERYYDCNSYMSAQGTSMTALGVEGYNDASECVSFSSTPLTGDDSSLLTTLKIDNTLNALVGEGAAINGNLQGYTYYDGPARMEYTRFINFRADATDTINIDNSLSRYLSTRVDARKMLDINSNVDQFGVDIVAIPPQLKGGTKHFGYDGDPAMAWIKGNSQSLPPTQYAINNLWENSDFKHQVFTETVNMNGGISDGDKQTIILDKDGTLAGYQVCNGIGCNADINHFPISLNNLTFYGTPYTVDEPDAIGRNNVIASAMMSPHKYATINIESTPLESVSSAPTNGDIGNGHFNLKIERDMKAYSGQDSNITLYGRGGEPVFETFLMNNMGYTVYPQLNAVEGSTGFNADLLLSYSDAPTDSLFINRVGVCLGTDVTASNLTVKRVLRQWGAGTNYLVPTPYAADMKNAKNCSAIFKDKTSSGWKQCNTSPPADSLTILSAGKSLADINTEFVSLSALQPSSSVSQSFYFDDTSGILYFNMVQQGDPANVKTITPPYAACDSSTYASAFAEYGMYKMFSNSQSINQSLKSACFFPEDQSKPQKPQNSPLINCPREGCVSYAVGFTQGANKGNGVCTAPAAEASIIEPSSVNTSNTKVTVNSANQLVYASPYWLKTLPVSSTSVVQPVIGKVAVTNYPSSSSGSRDFYFNCDRDISKPAASQGLLPLADLTCGTNNQINLLGTKAGIPTDFTAWNLVVGANVIAKISGANFAGIAPSYTPASSYTVPPMIPNGMFYISGSYPQTVNLSTTISGTTDSCSGITLKSGGTIDHSQCSSSFWSHIVVTPGTGGAPTTITVNP